MKRKATAVLTLAIGALVWWLLVFKLVPLVLTLAYEGDGLGFLNRWVHGRGGRPLSSYLGFWHRYALVGSGLVALLVAARHPLLSFWTGPVLDHEAKVSGLRTMELSIGFGLLAGLLEGLILVVWFLVEGHPSRQFDWEFAWMSAPASALAFLATGLALAALIGALNFGRRPKPFEAGLGAVVFVWTFAAAFAVLQAPRLGIAPWAVALLSLGLAVELARRVGERPAGFLALSRRLTLVLAAVTLISMVVGVRYLPSQLEQRRLAGLPDAEPGTPNILLVIWDTVRSRSLSLYDDGLATTPNLDRWAERGVVFERAISTSSWTIPAHASLFTGRWHHEVTADYGIRLDGAHRTLAEELSELGYQTVGFTANTPNTAWATGLTRGFSRYEDYPIGWGSFLTRAFMSRQLIRLIPIDKSSWRIGRKSAAENTDDALGWLRERADRPFFMFINYFDAHDPYPSPREFRERFPSDVPPKLGAEPGVTQEELLGTKAMYHASIAYVDSEMDRLLSDMDDEGLLDNTIVVVSSDHGEMMGEQGLLFHGNSLYMPVVRVPLLVIDPRGAPSTARVRQMVSTRNVAATLLDMIGADSGHPLGGESLAPLWRGPSESLSMDPIVSQVTAVPWQTTFDEGAFRSVIAEEMQYVVDPVGGVEFYDLARDPDQLVDLSGSPDMAARLSDFRARMDSVFGPTERAEREVPRSGRLARH